MAYQYQFGYPNFQQNQMNYQQPQMQSPVQNTSILYVDGDKGAEEFPMLPNTFAFLKSTDGKAVYFKQALANGVVACEKFILGEMQSANTQADYITRAEFEDFVKSLKEEKNEQSTVKYPKNNARTTKLQTADAKSRDN